MAKKCGQGATEAWEGVRNFVSLATLAESVIFPDISKVQTLILVMLGLIAAFSSKSSVTVFGFAGVQPLAF